MKYLRSGQKVRVIESDEIGTVVDDGKSANGWVAVIVDLFRGGRHVLENFDRSEIEPVGSLKMAVDPLVAATKKAYRSSDQYKLDQLLEEETRWKRKLTIASNKLQDVRDRINKFAKERVKV